jgi:hypothetical protein
VLASVAHTAKQKAGELDILSETHAAEVESIRATRDTMLAGVQALTTIEELKTYNVRDEWEKQHPTEGE